VIETPDENPIAQSNRIRFFILDGDFSGKKDDRLHFAGNCILVSAMIKIALRLFSRADLVLPSC